MAKTTEEFDPILEKIAESLLKILLAMLSLSRIKNRKKAIKYILTALNQYTKRIR